MTKALFSGRGLLTTLVVLAGVAFLCRLGFWQLDRHRQRAELNARIESQMALPPVPLDPSAAPESLDYRRVALEGVYDPAQEVLLRNRSYNGATGYHLLTPLRLKDGGAVLVNRGWVPLSADDPSERAQYAPPTGEVRVEGIARVSQPGGGGPQDPPLSAERPRLDAWFRVDTERIQQQTGYPLLPVFIQQQPGAGQPTVPPFPVATESLGLGSHLGYAIQWFSFAVILVATYLAVVYRQHRPGAPQARPLAQGPR
jgi:surfeit locus 1 family protein